MLKKYFDVLDTIKQRRGQDEYTINLRKILNKMNEEIVLIKNTINESISNNDYEKAFFMLVMNMGKLDDDERIDILIYYKRYLLDFYSKKV